MPEKKVHPLNSEQQAGLLHTLTMRLNEMESAAADAADTAACLKSIPRCDDPRRYRIRRRTIAMHLAVAKQMRISVGILREMIDLGAPVLTIATHYQNAWITAKFGGKELGVLPNIHHLHWPPINWNTEPLTVITHTERI